MTRTWHLSDEDIVALLDGEEIGPWLHEGEAIYLAIDPWEDSQSHDWEAVAP